MKTTDKELIAEIKTECNETSIVNKVIMQIDMRVNNEMSDFIREEVCNTDPFLKQYDFNMSKIVDAIRKQIAKKPTYDITKGNARFCATCGEYVGWQDTCTGELHTSLIYCPNCGQKIGWGNEK